MSFCAVILAAGRGKRMKSTKPKILHEVLGKPLIQYSIAAVNALNPRKLIIVVGNASEAVRARISNKNIFFIKQEKPLGTGHALLQFKHAVKNLKKSTVVVLNGDSPLITPHTLRMLLKRHKKEKNDLSFLSFVDDSLSGYGRIVRDKNGNTIKIVEDKHATPAQRKCKELNGGVYALEPKILHHLDKLKKYRSSGEYYLTDIVEIASRAGKKVNAYLCSSEEVRGVNTRSELSQVSEILNRRIVSKWMKKGVTFIAPSTSIVHHSVNIGKDSVIYPNTCLEGETSIGRNCVIFPGVRISDSILGEGVLVKDNTIIENSRIEERVTIGPFAHLRPGCVLKRKVKIGNFVELKASVMGDGSKASHFSYIGDTGVGRNVNIGAGTVTCNYNGQKKNITKIESGVFVGSNSQLVAPVKIGRDAYIAAGSTITRDVPQGALAVSRVSQKNLKGWVYKRRLKNKKR
jgi:bifunctional UDP-N-acetylglucosamine pyrophosphorylase/glucosamine-1-phosphate N-acetyltransferase